MFIFLRLPWDSTAHGCQAIGDKSDFMQSGYRRGSCVITDLGCQGVFFLPSVSSIRFFIRLCVFICMENMHEYLYTVKMRAVFQVEISLHAVPESQKRL